MLDIIEYYHLSEMHYRRMKLRGNKEIFEESYEIIFPAIYKAIIFVQTNPFLLYPTVCQA